MKRSLFICLFLAGFCMTILAQQPPRRGGGGDDGRSFSLSRLSHSDIEIPDSLLTDSVQREGVVAYNLSPRLGEAYIVPMDTNRLNFANSTLVEGRSLSVGYLANIGSPAQSRIFSERKEMRDFIFAEGYDYYITTPENACFYDTKIPYTNVSYTMGGSDQKKEERLNGVLTLNFGKQINIGAEMDYIYSRGHYNSTGNKLLSYRLFGNYLSDNYELRGYLSNYNFISHENGGLTDDTYVTDPDAHQDGKLGLDTKSFPVRYSNVFNRIRGKQYFLTHRYNLGFYRTLAETDEEGEPIEKFVPVSSIIHTLEYEDNRRHFYTSNQSAADGSYDRIYGLSKELQDRPSAWNLKNTLAISLREGFQDWVKFGLSAFVTVEKRRFKMMDLPPGMTYDENMYILSLPTTLYYPGYTVYDELSTYVGAELSKRQGSILTYNARGELCIVGDDLGEFRLTGDLQTRFPFLKKDAVIKAEGYVKNVTPAFYTRHNHSRYFWWDNNFKNEQQIYAGGSIHLERTRTLLSAGVNSIQNHIYYGKAGTPEQYDGKNLQVISARLKQDLYYRAFGWENEAAYQYSSNEDVIPLPQWSLYTNIYFTVKLAKVLTLQLGADAHYFSSYYAPYYEPATQQFQLQADDDRRVKIGGYPLINGYANLHLKQARFFITAYNLGTKFLDPEHFSFAHYPLNPFVLKFGISVNFNN
ncbi:putative porin [Parabacteroides sp. PF5-6]|uniref:putative porin n=1 Tax=Parabacteroides sp. PF5-6 TaxID=1742403 RepID=UPI002405AEBB|nr:putative porin [Parabacteroides sp. PF5-6]MDF9831277.1 hypothetical protein [Parabacteroides sp. PF5-6]